MFSNYWTKQNSYNIFNMLLLTIILLDIVYYLKWSYSKWQPLELSFALALIPFNALNIDCVSRQMHWFNLLLILFATGRTSWNGTDGDTVTRDSSSIKKAKLNLLAKGSSEMQYIFINTFFLEWIVSLYISRKSTF